MFPHFLCIGAGRSGTTWLYQNLDYCPEIWMTPVKELHYFKCPGRSPLLFQTYGARDILWRQLLRWQLKSGLRQMQQRAERQAHLGWYARYFLLPRSDAWYAGLFSPRAGQLTGDISPSYDGLDAAGVARIHALMPETKIIYLLRNPIDRKWSQAALFLNHRDWGLNAVPGQTMQAFLDRLSQVARASNFGQGLDPWEHTYSDYARHLDIWERYYPASQIFVGFFEQLVESPRELLGEILSFLGLPASSDYIPDSVERKVNPRQYPAMPPQIARQLTRRHYASIERLHQRFANRYTAGWLRDAQALVDT